MAKVVKNRGEYVVNVKELIASSIDDMNSTSVTQLAPGSKCFVLDGFKTYILSEANEWVLLPEETAAAPEVPEVDLTGYATEEWVNTKIALILDNPSVDVDSIAELAKVLEEGGADLVEIRNLLTSLTETVEANKAQQQTKNELLAQADQLLTQSIKNETAARKEADSKLETAITNEIITREQEDEKQQAQIDEHERIIGQIKLGEAMYRAQEVSPVDASDKSYSVKYDGATLNLQRRTDTNIVAVRLEGDDVVLRKLSGDNIKAEEISYNHTTEDSVIETGETREKPLCLIGIDNYATSESGYKLILDDNNCGIATNSDCSVLNYKEEYANVTPCIKIVDYFYEVVYTNNEPTSLKLLGGFFRKNEAGEFTGTKVGAFADIQHKVHLSFGEGTITIDCSTWPENNGTYRFIEDDKGISIEEPKNFTLAKDDTGYVFAITNLYHSAHIDSLSGEYDVEIRQYDAWHEGHKEGDNPYVSPIVVEYDTILNPCNYPRYYFTKVNDRIFFYKAYNESWGWKSGPFGMVITNGEFEKTTNINNPYAAVIKYIIDGNLLITGAYEIQEVSLSELATGTGTVITGNTPYAVNPGTGWGTSGPEVTDNNKRLGMFNYLTDNHDFSKGEYVHPVGNYNVCKVERWPITLIDGSQVALYEATVRGFETWLHGEQWEADSQNGKMYIQFIMGRATDDLVTLRMFYRTLTVGYERDEDGTLTDRRRTWSAFTEIATTTMLNKIANELQLQINELDSELSLENKNRVLGDAKTLEDSKAYTIEKVGALEKHLNEDFVALTSVVTDIKQPIYFDEYTTDDKVYTWSDMYKLFRKSTRGNMNEKVYIHAWVDYCGFNENNTYGFDIMDNDGNTVKASEFKGIFLVGPDGIVADSDNKIVYYKADNESSGDSGIMPVAVVNSTRVTTLSNSGYFRFVPCVGMTIDVPAFRLNSTTSQRTYEVASAAGLKNAIADAPAGATIIINDNIVSDSSDTAAFTINKPLTIVGDGNTTISSSTNKKLFEVYADVTLENLTLENVTIGGRCIDTRTDDITITLKGCTIKAANTSSNVQPVTIGGYNTDGLIVNIIDCTIDAGSTGYGIIAFVPATVNIINSTINGYAAIYNKVGSEGIVYNVQGSTLSSVNEFSEDSNAFGTIALESTSATFNIDQNSVVSATANGTQPQYLIAPEDFDTSNIIKVEGDLLAECFTSKGYTITSSDNNWNVIGNPIRLELTSSNETCIITDGKGLVSGEFSPVDGTVSFDIIIINENGDGGKFYVVEDSSVTGYRWEATVALYGGAGTAHESALQVKLEFEGQEKTLLLPIVIG